jgi:hypothetical protein
MEQNEKVNKLDEKINQLKAQKQAILSREKEKERKARTRRLIQIGAIVESMGINSVELADSFKSQFENNEKSKEWLKKFISNHQEEKK